MEENGEITILDLGKMIIKNWILLIIFLVLGIGIAISYCFFGFKEEYESNATVLVAIESEENPGQYDYNNSLLIIKTVLELPKQTIILASVAEGNSLTYEELLGMIQISNPSSSLLLEISCRCKDKELAKKIANDVVDSLIYQCNNNPSLGVVSGSIVKASNAYEARMLNNNRKIIFIGLIFIFIVLGAVIAICKEMIHNFRDKSFKNQITIPNQLENI